MKVAIQGQVGSFHAIAAKRLFGDDIELICCDSFKDAFVALDKNEADQAVVAIENSLYGSINDVYDLLLKYSFWAHAEIYEHINLNLFSTPSATLETITDVYSHPAALGESVDFLEENLPNAKQHEYADTAASALMVAKQADPTKAAIASDQMAKSSGLKVLASSIQTHQNNYTRFLALSNNQEEASTANKTSITFRTADKPGSLYAALGVFAEAGINLTKLESRPIVGEVWQYMYYIDFEAGYQQESTKQALESLKKHATDIRILGSYKTGEIVSA